MTQIELRIRIAQSLAEVPSGDWEACAAGRGKLSSREDNFSTKLSTVGGKAKLAPFVSAT